MTAQEAARAAKALAGQDWRATGVLSLNGLKLHELPELPPEAADLRNLDLSGNRFARVPEQVWALSALERLDLSANWLVSLGAEISGLAALRELDLSENRLTALPVQLESCRALERLDLCRNHFEDLTPLAGLPAIIVLDAASNRLPAAWPLPNPHGLESLDLSDNDIMQLPASFAELRALRRLDLSGNRLTSEALAPLLSLPLEELFLDDNELSEPPLALARLPRLRRFSAQGNPFGDLPAADLPPERVVGPAVERAVRERISGYTGSGLQLDAPTYSFNFDLGLAAPDDAHHVVDLYYKRFRELPATVRLGDGTSLRLGDVTRRTALGVVGEKAHWTGAARIGIEPTKDQQAVDGTALFVAEAVARLPHAELLSHGSAEDVTFQTGMLPLQEPVVKHVAAWIGEGKDDSAAVMLDQESSLSFKVGQAHPASLFEGDEAAIPLSDIPEAGLDTAWTVHAEGVVFSPSAEVQVLADDRSTIAFELHVPQVGDSATVTVTFTPRKEGTLRFDALLRAGGRIYRRLAAEVEVGKPTAVLEVKADTPFIRGDSIVGLPTGDPEYLDITLLADATALVRGRLPDGTTLNATVRWSLAAKELDDLLTAVRSAADKVRENHGAYLDDVPAEELQERLRGFEPVEDWTAAPDDADEPHRAAWAELRSSPELRKLAEAGHVAYNAIFPKNCELRPWVDALSPGARLQITTTFAEAGAAADVPWALLYLPRVDEEIDGAGFVGLRFRVVSYAYNPVTPANAFLGDANRAIKALCLFWGTEAPTAEETQRQRETIGALPGAVLVPSLDATEPRAALLSYLTKPDQTGPAVLYFFCHYGRIPPDEQGFRFGDDIKEPSVITTQKLGAAEAHGAPLVFANACATGAADAYHVSQVTRYFLMNGASAYLGTEVRVPPVLASRFASAFFSIFQPTEQRAPLTAGEALAQTRRFLWTQYRNLGGLFYTYVNEPDLRLVRAPVR